MQRRDLVADARWAPYLAKLYGGTGSVAPSTRFGQVEHQFDLVYRPGEFGGVNFEPVPSNHRARFCPRNASVAYVDFNVHAPLKELHGKKEWVAWYSRPRFARSAPLGDNAWVEVTHCAGSRFEEDGAWHYVAKGSGIWLNTGRTLAFTTHESANRHFLGARCKHFQCDSTIGNFTRAARAQGYDSLQFVHHCDGRCHGQCGHELLMTRAQGTGPCARGLTYRGGWRADEPCECVGWLQSRRGGTCAACASFVSRLGGRPHDGGFEAKEAHRSESQSQEAPLPRAARGNLIGRGNFSSASTNGPRQQLPLKRRGAASAADDRWAAVCDLERTRAKRWRSWLAASEGTSGSPGAAAARSKARRTGGPPRSFEDGLDRLERLLHTRGTLCSKEHPCKVERTTSPVVMATLANDSSTRSLPFRVCLGHLPPGQPTGVFCEPGYHAPSGGFVLKKACSRGVAGRCFSFDAAAIAEWATQLRSAAAFARASDAKSGKRSIVHKLERCAVVASGHSLRCGGPWAAAIDNRTLYDAVFRANFYPKAARDAIIGGTRTDFAAEPNHERCLGHKPAAATCLPSPKSSHHPLNRQHPRQPFAESTPLRRRTGLGLGHTGGAMVDQAVAFCSAGVDVFGMGLFSEGPGSDLLYSHWYDEKLPPACAPLSCSTSQGMTSKRDLAFFHAFGRMVCRPHEACSNSYAARMPYRSEHHDDFFYQAELRLHVLDALGYIRWVWY